MVSCNNDESNMALFAVKDTSDIAFVKLTDGENAVILQKQASNEWIVNQKYPANKKAIFKLMQCLTETKVEKPVPKNTMDSVIKSKDSFKKIELFNKRNKIIKSWLLGPYNKQLNGTIILQSESDKAYIVNIPGLVNNLHYRYESNSIYWIKSEIFSYQPHEIKSISVNYHNNKKKSFKISISKEDVSIHTENDILMNKQIDKKKVGSYLSYFMNVKFSSILNLQKESIDSIFSVEPDYTIRVEDIYNRIKNVDLKLIRNSDNKTTYDLNNVYAIINNEDLVKVKFIEIDLLLKDIDYFK